MNHTPNAWDWSCVGGVQSPEHGKTAVDMNCVTLRDTAGTNIIESDEMSHRRRNA